MAYEFKTDLSEVEKRVLADMAKKSHDRYLRDFYGTFNLAQSTRLAGSSNQESLTLAKLAEVMDKVHDITRWHGEVSDEVVLSHRRKDDLEYATGPQPWSEPRQAIYGGVKVVPSASFPMEYDCSHCDGTGEGETSTYCKHCHGAGRVRVEGMMKNGKETTFLTGRLPKKFQPSFPSGLVPKPPLSKGVS